MFHDCLCNSVLSVLSSCLVITCWERADSWLFCVRCFLCVCHFSIWCPGLGMVLDCIDLRLLLYFGVYANVILVPGL